MPTTAPTLLAEIAAQPGLDPMFAAGLRVQSATLAAEYTQGGRNREPILTFSRIENGRRTRLSTVPVAGKRDARAVAAQFGATCWNF